MEMIKASHIIPDYASIEESALYVIEHMESNFTEMMQQIGIEELQSVEESGLVLESEDESEKKVNKIIEWLKSIWAGIKGLYEKGLNTIKKHIETLNTKISTKIKTNLQKAADKLKEDAKFGEGHEWKRYSDILNNTDSIWTAIEAFGKKAEAMTYQDSKSTKIYVDNAKDAMFNAMKIDGITAENATGKISEAIKGDKITIDKAYVKANFADLYTAAFDYSKTAGSLKKNINTIKKSFDQTINTVKGWKNKNSKTFVKEQISAIKDAKKMYVCLSSSVVSCLAQRHNEAARIMLRIAVAFKAKEEKEAKAKDAESVKQESTIVPASFQTELTSLFDF